MLDALGLGGPLPSLAQTTASSATSTSTFNASTGGIHFAPINSGSSSGLLMAAAGVLVGALIAVAVKR